MTPRERILATINRQPTDRVPVMSGSLPKSSTRCENMLASRTNTNFTENSALTRSRGFSPATAPGNSTRKKTRGRTRGECPRSKCSPASRPTRSMAWSRWRRWTAPHSLMITRFGRIPGDSTAPLRGSLRCAPVLLALPPSGHGFPISRFIATCAGWRTRSCT